MQIQFFDRGERFHIPGAIGIFSASQLFRDPVCNRFAAAMTNRVSQFVAHGNGKQLVEGSAKTPYQFIASPRLGKEQSIFQECFTFRDGGKCGALAVEVKALNQRLPMLGRHDHPSPMLRCNWIVDQYCLQLSDAPLAFMGVISGAAEEPLGRESMALAALQGIRSAGARARAPESDRTEQARVDCGSR